MSTQGWTASTAATRRAGMTTTAIAQGRGHGKSALLTFPWAW